MNRTPEITLARSDAHLPFLDHLRGLAILFVFTLHSMDVALGTDHPAWNVLFSDLHSWPLLLATLPLSFGGTIGVAMFFVVSGFCIHLSHARSREKGFRVFFIRRFFRIYPPYLAALLFFMLLFPMTGGSLHLLGHLPQFLSHALLVHNLMGHRYYFGVNSSFWSIAVEAQLYLLYPLLLLMTRRVGWTGTLWITGVLEIALRLMHSEVHSSTDGGLAKWLFGFTLMYWFSWAIGAALAEDMLQGRPLFLGRLPVWLAVLVFFTVFFIGPVKSLSFTWAALGTGALISHFIDRRRLALPRTFGWEHLRRAGLVSYSFYLLHQPFLLLAAPFLAFVFPGFHPSQLALLVTCLAEWPFLLLLAWGFYRLIEEPSIAWGKMLLKRPLAPVVPATA